MTNEQSKKMLKAKLECLKRETSGTDFDCNRCNCDECSLNYEQGNVGEQKEALDTAIKVLEQQPCEDCVSRSEVRMLIWQNNDAYGYSDRFHEFTVKFLQLPSVTPARPKGEWLTNPLADNAGEGYFICSKCENDVYDVSDYCPNCGADMRGDANDNT